MLSSKAESRWRKAARAALVEGGSTPHGTALGSNEPRGDGTTVAERCSEAAVGSTGMVGLAGTSSWPGDPCVPASGS